MKTLRISLMTSLLLIACQSLFAYDFEVDGIYYYISSQSTYSYITPKVTVTEEGTTNHAYSGTINIPNTVTYLGVTYEVEAIESYWELNVHRKT